MKTIDALTKLIIAAAVAVLVLVVYTQSIRWFDLMYGKFRNQAIQDCFEISKETFVNPQTGVEAVVPNRETYRFCISEKGL